MRTMALLLVVVGHGFGCGGVQKNKLNTDTPVLPYVAPDVAELSGTDSDDDDEAAPTPAPAPAQNPQR